MALLMVLVLAPPAAAWPSPAPAAGSPAAREAPADALPDALPDAVAAAVPAAAGPAAAGSAVQVTVRREHPAGWAFGTAARPAPPQPHAYPDGWLWVARAGGDGRWRVALEGSGGFAALSRAAPVLAPAERTALAELTAAAPAPEAATGPAAPPAARPGASVRAGPGGREEQGSTDYRTGMRLPYAVGQSWRYTGGPHPMSGGVRSSIDLAGGDGRVLAARDGRAYTMCDSGTGWLRVVHDRGFATDYYHLEDTISADGRRVSEGDFLGTIGTDVSCGGSATGPHVHFSLRRDGGYVPIDRYGIGKWSVRAGDRPYQGYARHGSTRVDVGASLHNYGALGLTEAVVDTDGGGVLNRRTGPGVDHELVGTAPDGRTVEIECSARGTTHTGRDGYRSDLWNRLTDGSWVSDVYLWTGTGDPVAGRC